MVFSRRFSFFRIESVARKAISLRKLENEKAEKENLKKDSRLSQLSRHSKRGKNTLSDPYGTRTRVAGVKGRSPRPLDEGADECVIFDESTS